jgi:hypothetical protein
MKCSFVKLIFFVLFACVANGVFGQINGIVRDDQGIPLEGVHVWLSGTQSGDLTDSLGLFHLPINHGGPLEIVASYIGFKFYKKELTLRDTARSIGIRMRPSTTILDEVLITAQSSKKRKKWLSQFKKSFFGNSANAKFCEILNPDALIFEKTNEGLKVITTDVIKLRNNALAYDVMLHLDHAKIKESSITYSGKFLFTPIESSDPKEINRVERERRIAYLGSLNHFFYSLVNNTVRSEQFTMAEVNIDNGQYGEETALRQSQILRQGSTEGEYVLMFKHFLKVSYYGEDNSEIEGVDKIGYVARNLGRPAEQDMISQEKNELNKSRHGQVSFLFLKKVPVILLEGGYLKNPKYLEEQGYLGTERFAEMLPLEYGVVFDRNKKKSKKSGKKAASNSAVSSQEVATPAPEVTIINGFALTDLRIKEDEIKKGGPPRDGIPAIDYPEFVAADQAENMSGEDIVLGIVINGVARAYPTYILDRHELVNDVIGGVPVAVSYCPLCNSGVAFERNINGILRTFGVSGLLYNSDVLMYDREKESLWSQIMGEAISGADAGTSLVTLPVVMGSWAWWKNQHPQTEVLVGEEFSPRKYTKTAYKKYRSSESLMFAVAESSKQLANKDMVIGIDLNGELKAYSYRALAKSDGPVQDELNGEEILVHFDKENKTAWITGADGALLVAESMYWFAWFTFHPKTEVFK